jgi:hypothetical protein
MSEPKAIVFEKLQEPFSSLDIEWRIQSSGIKNEKPWAMVLAYVTARAIQNRLDDVCGPENWKVDYREGPGGGVLCGISIKINDEWVTKWDGAENTNIEAVKGGISSALKRAGSVWGIGRYLYSLKSYWAVFKEDGEYNSKIENGKWFKWNPPKLPNWALPEGEGNASQGQTGETTPQGSDKPQEQAPEGAQTTPDGIESPKEEPDLSIRITPPQIKMLNAKMHAIGIDGDEQRRMYVSEILGYSDVIPSLKNLTKALVKPLVIALDKAKEDKAAIDANGDIEPF